MILIFWLLVPFSVLYNLKKHEKSLVLSWIFWRIFSKLYIWIIADWSCNFPVGLLCIIAHTALESFLYLKKIALFWEQLSLLVFAITPVVDKFSFCTEMCICCPFFSIAPWMFILINLSGWLEGKLVLFSFQWMQVSQSLKIKNFPVFLRTTKYRFISNTHTYAELPGTTLEERNFLL